MNNASLTRIYKKLYRRFGPQHWWPARTRFEVIVGAVLTQNTAWRNVEKAIDNLRRHKLLSLEKMLAADTRRLARCIKPAGYFNIKAQRLKNVVQFLRHDAACLKQFDTISLRKRLLEVNGVGPETADSILLYAFDRPSFVVDAYTRRIFSRLGIVQQKDSYDCVKAVFENNLARKRALFNEYHALIVRLGKEHCTKNNPACTTCPLRSEHTYRR